jgi:hypothetical protein
MEDIKCLVKAVYFWHVSLNPTERKPSANISSQRAVTLPRYAFFINLESRFDIKHRHTITKKVQSKFRKHSYACAYKMLLNFFTAWMMAPQWGFSCGSFTDECAPRSVLLPLSAWLIIFLHQCGVRHFCDQERRNMSPLIGVNLRRSRPPWLR